MLFFIEEKPKCSYTFQPNICYIWVIIEQNYLVGVVYGGYICGNKKNEYYGILCLALLDNSSYIAIYVRDCNTFLCNCVGTMVSFFTVRPLALKYVYRKSDNRPTNNLAIIGRKGEVVTTINNSKNSGEVKIDGDIWRAQNVNNETIEAGEIVTVVDFKSITVFVKAE